MMTRDEDYDDGHRHHHHHHHHHHDHDDAGAGRPEGGAIITAAAAATTSTDDDRERGLRDHRGRHRGGREGDVVVPRDAAADDLRDALNRYRPLLVHYESDDDGEAAAASGGTTALAVVEMRGEAASRILSATSAALVELDRSVAAAAAGEDRVDHGEGARGAREELGRAVRDCLSEVLDSLPEGDPTILRSLLHESLPSLSTNEARQFVLDVLPHAMPEPEAQPPPTSAPDVDGEEGGDASLMVIEALRDVLTSDSSSLVPITGILSSLPLNRWGRDEAHRLSLASLEVVDATDLPAVVRTCLRSLGGGGSGCGGGRGGGGGGGKAKARRAALAVRRECAHLEQGEGKGWMGIVTMICDVVGRAIGESPVVARGFLTVLREVTLPRGDGLSRSKNPEGDFGEDDPDEEDRDDDGGAIPGGRWPLKDCSLLDAVALLTLFRMGSHRTEVEDMLCRYLLLHDCNMGRGGGGVSTSSRTSIFDSVRKLLDVAVGGGIAGRDDRHVRRRRPRRNGGHRDEDDDTVGSFVEPFAVVPASTELGLWLLLSPCRLMLHPPPANPGEAGVEGYRAARTVCADRVRDILSLGVDLLLRSYDAASTGEGQRLRGRIVESLLSMSSPHFVPRVLPPPPPTPEDRDRTTTDEPPPEGGAPPKVPTTRRAPRSSSSSSSSAALTANIAASIMEEDPTTFTERDASDASLLALHPVLLPTARRASGMSRNNERERRKSLSLRGIRMASEAAAEVLLRIADRNDHREDVASRWGGVLVDRVTEFADCHRHRDGMGGAGVSPVVVHRTCGALARLVDRGGHDDDDDENSVAGGGRKGGLDPSALLVLVQKLLFSSSSSSSSSSGNGGWGGCLGAAAATGGIFPSSREDSDSSMGPGGPNHRTSRRSVGIILASHLLTSAGLDDGERSSLLEWTGRAMMASVSVGGGGPDEGARYGDRDRWASSSDANDGSSGGDEFDFAAAVHGCDFFLRAAAVLASPGGKEGLRSPTTGTSSHRHHRLRPSPPLSADAPFRAVKGLLASTGLVQLESSRVSGATGRRRRRDHHRHPTTRGDHCVLGYGGNGDDGSVAAAVTSSAADRRDARPAVRPMVFSLTDFFLGLFPSTTAAATAAGVGAPMPAGGGGGRSCSGHTTAAVTYVHRLLDVYLSFGRSRAGGANWTPEPWLTAKLQLPRWRPQPPERNRGFGNGDDAAAASSLFDWETWSTGVDASPPEMEMDDGSYFLSSLLRLDDEDDGGGGEDGDGAPSATATATGSTCETLVRIGWTCSLSVSCCAAVIDHAHRSLPSAAAGAGGDDDAKGPAGTPMGARRDDDVQGQSVTTTTTKRRRLIRDRLSTAYDLFVRARRSVLLLRGCARHILTNTSRRDAGERGIVRRRRGRRGGGGGAPVGRRRRVGGGGGGRSASDRTTGMKGPETFEEEGGEDAEEEDEYRRQLRSRKQRASVLLREAHAINRCISEQRRNLFGVDVLWDVLRLSREDDDVILSRVFSRGGNDLADAEADTDADADADVGDDSNITSPSHPLSTSSRHDDGEHAFDTTCLRVCVLEHVAQILHERLRKLSSDDVECDGIGMMASSSVGFPPADETNETTAQASYPVDEGCIAHVVSFTRLIVPWLVTLRRRGTGAGSERTSNGRLRTKDISLVLATRLLAAHYHVILSALLLAKEFDRHSNVAAFTSAKSSVGVGAPSHFRGLVGACASTLSLGTNTDTSDTFLPHQLEGLYVFFSKQLGHCEDGSIASQIMGILSFLTDGLNKAQDTNELAWKVLHTVFPVNPDLHPLAHPSRPLWKARVRRPPHVFSLATGRHLTFHWRGGDGDAAVVPCMENVAKLTCSTSKRFDQCSLLRHDLIVYWSTMRQGGDSVGKYKQLVSSLSCFLRSISKPGPSVTKDRLDGLDSRCEKKALSKEACLSPIPGLSGHSFPVYFDLLFGLVVASLSVSVPIKVGQSTSSSSNFGHSPFQSIQDLVGLVGDMIDIYVSASKMFPKQTLSSLLKSCLLVLRTINWQFGQCIEWRNKQTLLSDEDARKGVVDVASVRFLQPLIDAYSSCAGIIVGLCDMIRSQALMIRSNIVRNDDGAKGEDDGIVGERWIYRSHHNLVSTLLLRCEKLVDFLRSASHAHNLVPPKFRRGRIVGGGEPQLRTTTAGKSYTEKPQRKTCNGLSNSSASKRRKRRRVTPTLVVQAEEPPRGGADAKCTYRIESEAGNRVEKKKQDAGEKSSTRLHMKEFGAHQKERNNSWTLAYDDEDRYIDRSDNPSWHDGYYGENDAARRYDPNMASSDPDRCSSEASDDFGAVGDWGE